MADDEGDELDKGMSDAAIEAGILEREKALLAAVKSGKGADALLISLADPPLSTKNQALKDRNAAAVTTALLAAGSREEQLASALARMDADQADVLMKYLYRGLQRPDNSALLLKVHGLLLEKFGMGSIVRAICDRKTA